MQKSRLDHWLVNNLNVATRSKAIDLIKRNFVSVNDQIINKPAFLVDHNDQIKINNQYSFVSKGAYKLLKLLNEIDVDIKDHVVVDLGASTGGFSDVCLQLNASKVYCVDVGVDLLDPKIANNPKVVVYDKTNVKDLSVDMFAEPIDLIVGDLSFISLKSVFYMISNLASKSTKVMLLVKPQFELGYKIASKYKGVIKDKNLQNEAVDLIVSTAKEAGFECLHTTPVDIFDPKKQNQEYMVYFKRYE
ncbi:TlyA family RNA methyltransferase [Ureaplasma diversum]|uniref:Hemolysin A n=1 Tax=Ureaplasma diversum NCTC 246 TaxID=1188241 RepID=A0A084EXY9_9BACT|nr:TlyA family RNA methyltransferase [Ureaplasma diversum]KEZ22831.1 Hemolysin A [Ureaplasma diversum NCTC 246]